MTPDGRSAIVATAAGAVVSVDLGTASVATVLPQRPVAAQVVSATADGRVLVGFDDGDVVIVGRSGTPERTIRTSSVAPRAVAIVPAADGGEMLASIDARGLVGLWPAGGGTRSGRSTSRST